MFALVVMIGLTLYLAWSDLKDNSRLTDDQLKNLNETLLYWVESVIPYWWLLVTIGTFVLSMVTYGLASITKKFISQHH